MKRYMLLAAILCATPARAQDAAEEPDGYFPATAENFGVTQEQFARLGIAEGTRMRPWRNGISVGAVVFGPPVAVPLPTLAAAAAEPGAVIARETVRTERQRWALGSSITVGAPFNASLPAGREFHSVVSLNGDPEPCITTAGGSFTPWLDGKRNIYFSICLGARDGQGRYTTARFLPYRGEEAPLRVMPIAPVRLDPLPMLAPFSITAQIATRRLRVATVDADSAFISLEDAALRATRDGGDLDSFVVTRPWRSAGGGRIELREGATVVVDGVTVTARRAGAGWSLSAAGRFSPFAYLNQRGTDLYAGTPPRP